MADGSRPRWGVVLPIVVAVVGLLGIMLAQGTANRHSIEDDLTGRSVQALQSAGLPEARVSFVGRDGTVRVSSVAEGERAADVVAAQDGVRVVRVEVVGVAAPPAPSPTAVRTPSPSPSPSTPTRVQGELAALPPVTFENASATLTAQGQAAVAEAAVILAANPAVRVRIEGHTDTTGPAQSNLDLSQARAQAVLSALLARGVAADRMTATGFGETRLTVPDTSPANQAVNRRVEFVVLP